jgi:hypothetical protein
MHRSIWIGVYVLTTLYGFCTQRGGMDGANPASLISGHRREHLRGNFRRWDEYKLLGPRLGHDL